MRTVIGAMLAMALPLAVQAEARTAPLMTILIKPGPMSEAVGKGPVDIAMAIPAVDAPAGKPLFSMGLYTPGLAHPHTMSDIAVTDASGPVPMTVAAGENGPRRWTPSRAVKGEVKVTYTMTAENVPALVGGPPTSLRIDGDGVSGVGDTFFLRTEIPGDRRIAITWDTSKMTPGATGVSSWGDGDVELPAGPISRIYPAVYMAGSIKREPGSGEGAFSAVWVGQPPFDPRPPMQWTGQLHAWMSKHFKDPEEPPYRVFMRFNPMNAGGGAALTHSFNITYGKDVTG